MPYDAGALLIASWNPPATTAEHTSANRSASCASVRLQVSHEHEGNPSAYHQRHRNTRLTAEGNATLNGAPPPSGISVIGGCECGISDIDADGSNVAETVTS